MFNRLLIPIDGSDTSQHAAEQAILFAQEIGARVTALHVIPEFHVFSYQSEMLEDTREEFSRGLRAAAQKYLDRVQHCADTHGVSCDTAYVANDRPYEAINEFAKEKGCDLIAMASHGRKGIRAVLLGSETQRVLAHAGVPVLVLH